jgi:hypothetical protein
MRLFAIFSVSSRSLRERQFSIARNGLNYNLVPSLGADARYRQTSTQGDARAGGAQTDNATEPQPVSWSAEGSPSALQASAVFPRTGPPIDTDQSRLLVEQR